MCFISKKKWNELNQTVQDLSGMVSSLQNNEIAKLRKESEDFKNIKELLKPIKFKVKSVRYLVDADKGVDMVKIEYEIPDVVLEFDHGEQTNKNEFLRSSNILNFIGLEDQMKIAKEIKKAKERSKNE